VPGEQFRRSDCNGKIVGARWFNAAFGGDAGLKAQRPWEFASARDYNGHGTHTAATAAGNNGVTTNGAAAIFGRVSGMAPRARIAVYKALWSTQDASTASGFNSDIVAAIDQAVADGVDVINFSISGTQTDFLDPAEIAFLFAATQACSSPLRRAMMDRPRRPSPTRRRGLRPSRPARTTATASAA
jgi:subtilisin family serine protease